MVTLLAGGLSLDGELNACFKVLSQRSGLKELVPGEDTPRICRVTEKLLVTLRILISYNHCVSTWIGWSMR